MFPDWLHEFGFDMLSLLTSIVLVLAYYAAHAAYTKRNPAYSMHHVNELARKAWAENVMNNPGKDVMAVQSLRNFIMYGILMVSTSTLLIIGTLTLSGQADNLSRNWHILNLGGSHSTGLWIVKVMCLLGVFLVAFFAYALSIRLANQVLFMLNVPKEYQATHEALSPQSVAIRLNRAGQMVAIGLRAYFLAIPLVFWLFGPVYMLLATICVIGILSRLDRHQDGI